MYQGYAPSPSPMVPEQIKGITDQLYRRIDGSNQPLDIFANALINGSFDTWQRGTSFTTAAYAADRWLYQSTSGAMSYSRQAFAPGDIQSESRYFARLSISGQSAASDFALFQQPVEGVRRFAGRRVVIRGMARRSSGSGNVAVELQQYSGSTGFGSTTTYAGTIALSTLWTPFALIANVPSLAGLTIGTVNDALYLNFFLSAGSNFNSRTGNLGLQSIQVDFADLELKEVIPGYGDQFPGLERVPFDLDYLRCLRYYEITTLNLFQVGVGSGVWGTSGFWHVPKRVSPSVTSNLGGAGYTGLSIGGDVHSFQVQFSATQAGAYAVGVVFANAEL